MSNIVMNLKFFFAFILLIFVAELLFYGHLSAAMVLVLIFTLTDAYNGFFIRRDIPQQYHGSSNWMNGFMMFVMECIYTFLPTLGLAISGSSIPVFDISAKDLLTISVGVFIALKLFLSIANKLKESTYRLIGLVWKLIGIGLMVYVASILIYESIIDRIVTGTYLGIATLAVAVPLFLILTMSSTRKRSTN